MIFLLFIRDAFLLLWLLWVLYVFTMAFKRVYDLGNMHWLPKILGWPVALCGILLDWLLDQTLFIVLFWDKAASKKELITGRLKRYKAGPDGKRKRVTMWLAKVLLDEYDPSGRHV